ncbi:MAG: hypothetical protein AAFR90_15060 [Pseudomonadota bacterium]
MLRADLTLLPQIRAAYETQGAPAEPLEVGLNAPKRKAHKADTDESAQGG